MTYSTAHKILSAHQAWRRGLVDALEYTAAEVNDALEFAIAALQSDQETPDWSKAPEWAQWYAIDGDGQRWWFEIEPTFKGTIYNGLGKIEIDNLPERMKLFKRPEL